MAWLLVRIHVDDYEAWKARFDQDPAGARGAARGHRVRRSIDDPNTVYVEVEFDSAEDANRAREKLLASGVLEQFDDRSDPVVVEEAETVRY